MNDQVNAVYRTYCRGSNSAGQLGAGFTGAQSPTPVVVRSGTNFRDVEVAAGNEHSCAISSRGTITCWGSNAAGQSGHGGAGGPLPVQVSGVWDIVAAGGAHTCALEEGLPVDTEPGYAYCWGSNGFGQLGNGTRTSTSAPVRVR